MMRLDVFLVTFGYADSRTQARRLIEEGSVLCGGKIVDKPSFSLDEESKYDIRILQKQKYVSRGGLKLEKALDVFSIDVQGLCVLDIGASTGGFTDCLLQRGAKKVYALDAGEGQLASKLILDARVINMEKYNARTLSVKDFSCQPAMVVMDVSFISQTLILPALSNLLKENGVLISLIKPQFEAGRGAIGKNGIVKSEADRCYAMERVLNCAQENGLSCFGLDVSPILGGDGNVEYIAAFRNGGGQVFDRSKCLSLAKKI